jgi:hypothetical protein
MVPIIENRIFVFTYDHDASVLQNFDSWRILNHEERSAWGEPLLTWEEGKNVFEAQYSVKVPQKNG